MQSNITFKKIWKGATVLSFSLFLLFVFSLNGAKAQTTLTTTYTVNRTNGLVTFNFTNSNAFPVRITKISSDINLPAGGKADVSAYFNTSAISGNPGPISAANGWAQFLGSLGITATGDGNPQPFGTANLTVPAGSTYGIAVNAFVAGTGDISNAGAPALAYSNITTPATVTAGGCTFTTGRNIGWAGAGVPNAPVTNARAFVGSITFVTDSACSGTPAPGNTISSASSSCPANNFILSAQNNPAVTGLTYQWQSSPAMSGPFVNIDGATGSFYTANLTANTYYLVIVTCGTSSTPSIPVLVSLSAICYCAAGSTDNNPGNEKISNVSFSNVNQSSTSGSGYESFVSDTAKVIAGATYPLSITLSNGFTTDQTLVWIDFNQNGSFTDPGDLVYTSAIGGPFTGNIIIPASAKLGFTRMRVRLHDTGGASPNSSPCGNSDFGQVEDYTVNILACVPVTITGPIDASTACDGTATFSVTPNADGSFPTYQWQFRTSPTGAFMNVPNIPPYSGANTSTLTINPASVAMSGYQYRVLFAGTCSATDFSTTATLTINPIVAIVSPAATVICKGGIQSLSLSNTLGNTIIINEGFDGGIPQDWATQNMSLPIGRTKWAQGNPTFAGFTSHSGPPTSFLMSDFFAANQNGAPNTISNWLFTPSISIKNGDILSFWTRQPGGTDYPDRLEVRLSTNGVSTNVGTTATTVGDFTNLLLSVNPTLVTGVYPKVWTMYSVTVSGLAAPSTGRIAFRVFDTDDGTGANENVVGLDDVVYTSTGSSAQGIYSTNATGPNTIFSDSAATVAYTGTPTNTVYVKPTATTTYTVYYTTPSGCVSDPTSVTVTVNSPLAGIPSVKNVNTCVGLDGIFTVSGITGGTGLIYQFQVNSLAAPTVFDNVGTPSATPSLSVSNSSLGQSGLQYRVIVSAEGCSGSATSVSATLTVNPIPVVTINAAPRRNLFPGLTTTLTASVSSTTGPITYQWFRNGIPVPGAMSSTLVVKIDGVGIYSVIATAQGCSSADSTTTPQTITIGDSSGVTKLFIYPSPNNGKFQVRYFSDINIGSKNPAMLNVYDEKGTRVFSKNYGISPGYQQMNVDLGSHSSGIYRVELLDLNGDRIKTGSVFVF